MSSDVVEMTRVVSALPDDWREVTLGDIITLEYGRSLPDKVRRAGDVAVYGSNGVVGAHDEALVTTGGIIVGRKGTAGSVTVSPGPFWPIDTTYFVKARQTVDWDWLAATLHHARLNELNEATGVPGLNRDKVYRQSVLLPPLDEQRRIAEVLRSVDDAIAANGEAVDQLRITRDAIRDEHFRASQMDSHARTLGSVCDITKLAGFEYSKHIQYGESDEIIAVRGLNMKDGQLSLDDVKTISRATSQALPRSALRKGDLVMSYVGTIGEVAKIDADDRYHLAPNVALLRCGAQALPDYILHFLYSRSGREQISKYVSTSSQQSLSMGKIRSFEIDLPSVDDQRRITETMDTLNASLVQVLQTQSQLLTQKRHLLNGLLSGHVRVPT